MRWGKFLKLVQIWNWSKTEIGSKFESVRILNWSKMKLVHVQNKSEIEMDPIRDWARNEIGPRPKLFQN